MDIEGMEREGTSGIEGMSGMSGSEGKFGSACATARKAASDLHQKRQQNESGVAAGTHRELDVRKAGEFVDQAHVFHVIIKRLLFALWPPLRNSVRVRRLC